MARMKKNPNNLKPKDAIKHYKVIIGLMLSLLAQACYIKPENLEDWQGRVKPSVIEILQLLGLNQLPSHEKLVRGDF